MPTSECKLTIHVVTEEEVTNHHRYDVVCSQCIRLADEKRLLSEEIDVAVSQIEMWKQQFRHMVDERDKLRQQRDDLRYKLKYFGTHKSSCAHGHWDGDREHQYFPQCNCGFDNALRSMITNENGEVI